MLANHITNREDECIAGALLWAQAQLGSAAYVARCYAFVEDAYELGNDIWLDGQGSSAKEAAEAYDAQGHTGLPPQGAYVCYDCSGPVQGEHRNWGHIGLSMGDGRVIHAWDRVRMDDYLAIQELSAPGWTKPAYIGWVPASVILVGMRPREQGEDDAPGKADAPRSLARRR